MSAFKYLIHFTLPDGTEDSLIIKATTLEEVRKQAGKELIKRNSTNEWSEKI